MSWNSMVLRRSLHLTKKAAQTKRWNSEKPSCSDCFEKEEGCQVDLNEEERLLFRDKPTKYVSHILTMLLSGTSLINKQFIHRKAN